LKNLELIELDLHKVGELSRKFDLIYATGVLHHLPEPRLGLQALLPALAEGGVICAMLYARYGRAGVYMVQDALRRLRLAQTPSDVKTARQVLAALPKWHAAQPYIRGATRDTGFDGGIVDTFLHAEDHAFTVPEILDLASSCGLAFQGWTDNLDYYPDGPFGHNADVCAKIAALPEQEQWAVVELLAPALAAHSFLLRRKSVAIPEDAIPARRHLLNVDHAQGVTTISRSGNVTRLEGFEAQVFAAIDGETKRSVIIAQVARGNKEAACRVGDLLAKLWRLGHITMCNYE
jgi:SAM-dependent methyltransferase